MLRQQLGCSHLIVPGKTSGAISSEPNIVRWVRIDEIFRLDWKFREIFVRKFPATKQPAVGVKVGCVVYSLVLAERYVKFAVAIEAAQTVETRAVQIIKKLRCFLRAGRTSCDELIEASAMPVEKRSVVARVDLHRQPTTHVPIKIDQMRIDIVQQGALRLESKRNCQPATKWFNVTTVLVRTPKGFDTREQPALAARPL